MSFSLRELSDKSTESENIKESFGKAKKDYYYFENLGRKLTREEQEQKNKAYIDMVQASNLHLSTYGKDLTV